VYNLTLLEHNAYYASGVLVANCGRSPDLFDGLVAGVEGAIRLGFAIRAKASPEQRKERAEQAQWKREAMAKGSQAWSEGSLDYSA
jgi:hypothetical protein